MSEIEKNIEVLQERKLCDVCADSSDENCRNCKRVKGATAAELLSAFNAAIEALREKAERDVGCEVCRENENFFQTKFGYCFYSLGDNPLIYNLYVHLQHRRRGHSKTLLQCVIGEIRKTGHSGEIYIQAKSKENSMETTDLIKYYESMGLVVLKERENSVPE